MLNLKLSTFYNPAFGTRDAYELCYTCKCISVLLCILLTLVSGCHCSADKRLITEYSLSVLNAALTRSTILDVSRRPGKWAATQSGAGISDKYCAELLKF